MKRHQNMLKKTKTMRERLVCGPHSGYTPTAWDVWLGVQPTHQTAQAQEGLCGLCTGCTHSMRPVHSTCTFKTLKKMPKTLSKNP